MRPFEFDPAKSVANKRKHGIDFNEAQTLWNDENRIESPARFVGEPRARVIGLIGLRHWTAFITYRHDSIRLISCRRSRAHERTLYVRAQNDQR
jgi:uncharacterized protein